jgi:hypothetical protein
MDDTIRFLTNGRTIHDKSQLGNSPDSPVVSSGWANFQRICSVLAYSCMPLARGYADASLGDLRAESTGVSSGMCILLPPKCRHILGVGTEDWARVGASRPGQGSGEGVECVTSLLHQACWLSLWSSRSRQRVSFKAGLSLPVRRAMSLSSSSKRRSRLRRRPWPPRSAVGRCSASAALIQRRHKSASRRGTGGGLGPPGATSTG